MFYLGIKNHDCDMTLKIKSKFDNHRNKKENKNENDSILNIKTGAQKENRDNNAFIIDEESKGLLA